MIIDSADPVYKLYLKVRAINDVLEDRNSCFYCGDYATDEDHVVPHSFLYNGSARRNYEKDTLPSCRECNGLLGSSLFETLDDRIDHVLEKIKKRYKKELTFPEWTKVELRELSPRLRKQISDKVNARKWLELRIKNLLREDSEIPATAILDPAVHKIEPPTGLKAALTESDGSAVPS